MYVWGPWLTSGMQCTAFGDRIQACMPVDVVPAPLRDYCAFGAGSALVALVVVTAAVVDVHGRVNAPTTPFPAA